MGWAKRLWARKSADHGTGEDGGQGRASLRGKDLALLRSLEGCLEVADRLRQAHLRWGRDLVGEDREVHEMVSAAGEGVVRGNLELLFGDVDEEAPRMLLAQVLLQLYGWDPPSVVFTMMDFDQQQEGALAVVDLAERLAEATRTPPADIMATLPESVESQVQIHALLHTLRRPLGVLAPRFPTGPWDRGRRSRADGALVERDVERGGLTRTLLLRTRPWPDDADRWPAQRAEYLTFTPEEVMGSSAPSEAVLAHVRDVWGWRAMGEGGGDADADA